MKTRIRIGVAALLVIFMAVTLTGCFQAVLFGHWKLKSTSKTDGTGMSEPPFSVVMTLEKDGKMLLYGSEFGSFSLDRNNFTLNIKGENGEDPTAMTGGWEISGSELIIYPDGQDMRYIFGKIAAENANP